MPRFVLGALLLLFLFDTCVARAVVTAYYNPQAQQWSFELVEDASGVATAVFYDEMNITGWDRLYVRSNPSYSNDLQAYAAGESKSKWQLDCHKKIKII